MADLGRRLEGLSPEKRALLEQRLGRSPKSSHPLGAEPVAIIGMGCRFPGGASSPEAFWRLLTEGRDAIRRVPVDRWDADAVVDPSVTSGPEAGTRWGGFLDRVDEFDPGFFNIAPREASQMDPQQRLLLEVAWEALEEAGQTGEGLAGSATGVFVGIHSQSSDYYWLQVGDHSTIDTYTASGGAHSIMANRLSYLLDLRGPSVALDTACSSSLVALHLACQSLRTGDSDMALAGGVNLILSPETGLTYAKMQMLAPDGRCKTFDASANGFVRGEGCGLVVLRRLADALRDGDPILAVIRGTAVNQDGATNGLTAPNGLAQQAVVRRALALGGVDPDAVGYVETHGTGTTLGDPIEVEALTAVVGRSRPDGRACVLGAVKANIGHLEAAAGVAGLIKTVLCFRHEAIPPQPHFRTINPHIELAGTSFTIPTVVTPWGRAAGPRIAGISSFGFGGTNAHLVVEEAPTASPVSEGARGATAGPLPDGPMLLPISARSADALQTLAKAYQERADSGEWDAPEAFRDLCYTAGVRRSHHDHRLAVAARDARDCAARLRSFLAGEASPQVAHGRVETERRAGPVFVFSGQGPQWPGMGRELLECEPIFRAVIERCDALVQSAAGWSLLREFQMPEAVSRLAETEVAQPALFALQVGLAALWRAWGMAPSAVVGHSLGEVAAAHVAGALSLEEAVRVVVHRGRIMQQATGRGRMASVDLSPEEAAGAIAGYQDRLAVGAVNAPASTVLSGDGTALDDVMADLAGRGVRCQPLPVNYAFHSHQMEPLAAELVRVLGSVAVQPTTVPMFSTVTGRALEAGEGDAAYWGRNVRQPVLFAAAVAECLAREQDDFLEIGPHPVLSGAIAASLAAHGRTGVVAASLRRKQPERTAMLSALGTLYAHGVPVDWRKQHPTGGRCVQLPAYPWQRTRHWLEGQRARSTQCGLMDREAWRDWIYEMAWRPKERSEGGAALKVAGDSGNGLERQGSWLILGDERGVGEQLKSLLAARGIPCFVVSGGDEYKSEPDGRFRVDPARPGDYRRLIAEVQRRGIHPVRNVVHLWALDAAPASGITSVALDAAQTLGCRSLLYLLQALKGAEWRTTLQLWSATRGAQLAGSAPGHVEVLQAPVWGLGRVMILEHPDLWGGLVDLDPDLLDPAGTATVLLDEIQGSDGEDQVAFRGGRRHVLRLVRANSSRPGKVRFGLRPDAAYLITGGLGALGLQIARWMVENGARHLVLMSRRGLPDRASWDRVSPDSEEAARIAQVRALEALGATMTVVAADVADASRVSAVFEEIERTGPPLRGIIHAAGVASEVPAVAMDTETLDAVLRPKVLGSWVLHELTRGRNLDLFVMFSSVAAVWGSRGLAHYAAANHFLDALAHHRRFLGLSGLSVDWGWWATRGLATADMERFFAQSGLMALPPERALAILARLLEDGVVQQTVAAVDWHVFKSIYGLKRHRFLFDDIAADPAPAAEQPMPQRSDFLQRLEDTPSVQRREILLAHVRTTVAKILGFGNPDAVELRQGFFKMGMDSILTVQLRNQLEAALARSLPPTVAFEYPTVEALTDHLLKILEPAEQAADLSTPSVLQTPLTGARASNDDLSEEALTALLAEKLRQKP